MDRPDGGGWSSVPKKWGEVVLLTAAPVQRLIIQDTISDMDLDPAAEVEVIEAFTCAGLPCIDQGSIISKRSGIFAWPT